MPSFAHQLRQQHQQKTALAVKSAPYLWMTYSGGVAQWHLVDYAAYIRDGFETNALIYSAIMYKVRAVSVAPLRAYKGEQDNPVPLDPRHPLSELVARPNPFQSWMEFQQLQVGYINLSGNSYTFLDRGTANTGLPAAMYPLRPDRVTILPKDRKVIGYWYVPEGKSWGDGVPILPKNIVHVKFPNPGDPFEGQGYGLSPLAPAARSGDVDNMITKFLWNFFKKGGVGMTAVQYPIPLMPETLAKLREEWQLTYGGFENWDRPVIIDSQGKIESITPSFKDMGFDQIDSRTEARILGPFGVPGMLIGARTAMGHSAFANWSQAEEAFWKNTMQPELQLFEQDWQYALQSDDGGWVRYDTTKVPALQTNTIPLVTPYKDLVSTGVPPVIAAKTVGLKMERWAGDELSYLPMGVTPTPLPEDPADLTPPASAPAPSLPSTTPTPPADGAPTPNAEDATQNTGKRLLAALDVKKNYPRLTRLLSISPSSTLPSSTKPPSSTPPKASLKPNVAPSSDSPKTPKNAPLP